MVTHNSKSDLPLCMYYFVEEKRRTLKGALDRCLMVKHLLLACCMRGERERAGNPLDSFCRRAAKKVLWTFMRRK